MKIIVLLDMTLCGLSQIMYYHVPEDSNLYKLYVFQIVQGPVTRLRIVGCCCFTAHINQVNIIAIFYTVNSLIM